MTVIHFMRHSLLGRAKLLTLQNRRLQDKATLMFKVKRGGLYNEIVLNTICHFRVAVNLIIKVRLSAKFLL